MVTEITLRFAGPNADQHAFWEGLTTNFDGNAEHRGHPSGGFCFRTQMRAVAFFEWPEDENFAAEDFDSIEIKVVR